MNDTNAGGVAGVLESLSVKWHMEANALDKSFSPGSGIMAAERRARALELEAALAAIGSAAPAGDGECCANSGTYACKCSQFTPATHAGGGDLPELPPLPKQIEGYDGDYWTGEQIEEYARAYGQQCRLASTQAAGGGGELLAVRTMDDLRNAAAGADYYFRPVQMRPQDAREILARLASTGSAQSEPQRVECRECGECGHVGINDLSLTDDACGDCGWSGPAPTEDKCPECSHENCMGAACPGCGSRYRLIAESELPATGSAPAPSGDDTERLDWIESQVKAYGDGYTEPREAGFAIEWRQEKPNDYWPGLRAWIDAERARGDGLDFDLPAAPTQEPPRKTSRVYETEARIEPFLKKEPTP